MLLQESDDHGNMKKVQKKPMASYAKKIRSMIKMEMINK